MSGVNKGKKKNNKHQAKNNNSGHQNPSNKENNNSKISNSENIESKLSNEVAIDILKTDVDLHSNYKVHEVDEQMRQEKTHKKGGFLGFLKGDNKKMDDNHKAIEPDSDEQLININKESVLKADNEQTLEDYSHYLKENILNSKEIKQIQENFYNIVNTMDTICNDVKELGRFDARDKKRDQIQLKVEEITNNVKFIETKIDDLKKSTSDEMRYIIQKELKNYFNEVRTNISNIRQKIDSLTFTKEIKDALNPIQKALSSVEEYMVENFQPEMNKRLKAIESTTEMIQGKFNLLDQIEDIKKTLSDKGVSIKQELPPANEEDEMIQDLALYGQKIFDQLTIAARHYARNKKVIENIRQEKIENSRAIEQTKKDYLQRGIAKGKSEIVTEIISNFLDLDKLFDCEDNTSRILVAFLKNNGLIKDVLLAVSERVTITEENRGEMEIKAKFLGFGDFVVIKSCFNINDEIYCKAELKKIEIEVLEAPVCGESSAINKEDNDVTGDIDIINDNENSEKLIKESAQYISDVKTGNEDR